MRNGSFLRCRLCLGESKLLVLGDELRKLIQDLLIPQTQHWPEPEHVCNACVDYLKVFQKFKKKVLKVQEKLEATLQSSIQPSTPTTPIIRRDETYFVDPNKAFASKADSIVYAIVQNLDINETPVDGSKNVRSNDRDAPPKKHETPHLKARQRIEPIRSDVATIKMEKTDSRGKELLKCSLCDGSFNFAATLETHLRKRHALLKCQSCNYSSNTRRNYVRHIRSHQNLTFKHKVCSICFTICKDSAELFAHRKKAHSSTVEPIENTAARATQSKKKSKPTIQNQEPNLDQVQSKTLQENKPREKPKQKSSEKNIQSNVPPESELPKKRVKKSKVEKPESNTLQGNVHREERLQPNIHDESGYRESQNRESNLELPQSSTRPNCSPPKQQTKEAEKPQLNTPKENEHQERRDLLNIPSQKQDSNSELPQSSICSEKQPPKKRAKNSKPKKSKAKKSKKLKTKKPQLNTAKGDAHQKKRVQSNIKSQNQELSPQLVQSSTRSESKLPKGRVGNFIAEKHQLNTDEGNEHQEERVQSNIHNESRCREIQNRELNSEPPQSSTRPENVLEETREIEENSITKENRSQSLVIDRNLKDNEILSQHNTIHQKTIPLIKRFRCPKSCGKLLPVYYQLFEYHLRHACPQTYNRLNLICEICQYSSKHLSKYIRHVYKQHARESNQQEYDTRVKEPQKDSQCTPKKHEVVESMTKNVHQGNATENSDFVNSSSKKRKLFDESSNTSCNSERIQNRKRLDSRSSNHEYYDENQSFQGNIRNERRSVSRSRFESDSFKNRRNERRSVSRSRFAYRNSPRPPFKRNFSGNFNSRKFIPPNTLSANSDYQVPCSPFDSAITNSTKSNYQVLRSPFPSPAQHEFIHQQRGYQNEQRSKIVESLHDEGRQNIPPGENTCHYDRKGAEIKWKMKFKENTRDDEKKSLQWCHENESALSDAPLDNFGTIKCTLEKIDDKFSIPPDVKPSLETINKNLENRWQKDGSTESSLKYYCNLCGKLEIHNMCAGCGVCFRSMSLYVDHMRKRH